MTVLDKFLSVLNLQIKDSSAKLPKKVIQSQKIQDNNQAISTGAINEDNSKSVLRSKSSTGTNRRRSSKS